MTRVVLEANTTPKPLPAPLAMSAAPAEPTPSPIPKRSPSLLPQVDAEDNRPVAR